MNSNFKVALELLSRYSVRFHPHLTSAILTLFRASTDTPLRRYPPVTARPRTNRPYPEQCCCPILPAIRVDQARTHERCIRVDRRGGRVARRQPDTSRRDPRAGG